MLMITWIQMKRSKTGFSLMNDGLAYVLEACDFFNFQVMVDKALVLENRRGIMERKKKMHCTVARGSNMRFHVGFSSQGPIFHHCQLI
jgi:hypothetical protein